MPTSPPPGSPHGRGTSLSRDLRINEMIRVPQVRVVDEDGSQLGVMPTGDALRLAQDKGVDLVEVAPMAAPPVTRLLDYGQYKYEQTRREKEARRHQRSVEFKEVRLTPKIGRGDFDTKVRRAVQFLEDGDRIKVSCRFRGRELTHAYLGRDLLLRFADQVQDHGTIERQPLLEGKSMWMVITSTHKPKIQAAGHVDGAAASPSPAPTDGAEAKAPAPPAPVTATPAPIEEPAPAATKEPADEPVPDAASKPAPAAKSAPAPEPAATTKTASAAKPAATTKTAKSATTKATRSAAKPAAAPTATAEPATAGDS
ncbi:MAG TPA: translation initiation factor IF-3 [Candidatus Limnocylindrales bacterium]